jgi:RNA-directed DNA polymerase
MLRAQVVMPDGVVVATTEGTPQGGPLSPLLSNIVLHELDEELARRGHRFVRYADDCNIYVRSERAGHRVMASVVDFIERTLRLKVNAAKSAVARPEERHFVGFCLRREPRSGSTEVLLSKRSKDRLDERIRQLTPRTWGQSIADCIRAINAYLRGWYGFFGICTTGVLPTLDAVDGHLRRRLRAIQLRHWKQKRTIIKRLIGLGLKPKTTAASVCTGRRGWWALSHSWAANHGMNVAYFTKRGLLSLRKLHEERTGAIVTVSPSERYGG